MLEKECEICGAIFEVQYPNQKYCGECKKNPTKARAHYRKAVFINKVNAGDLYKKTTCVCEQCGKKFSSYGKKFCSPSCQVQHNIESAKCCNCGKPLIDFGIKIKTAGGWHYCSDACKQDFRLSRARERGQEKTCIQCGKSFVSSSTTKKFCCKECYQTALAEGWRPKQIDPPKKIELTPHTSRCAYCGKTFTTVVPHSIYCSQDCNRKAQQQAKLKKQEKKEQEEIKKRGLCFLCKTPYADCERMCSGFRYSPEGAVFEAGKIVKCPKFKK